MRPAAEVITDASAADDPTDEIELDDDRVYVRFTATINGDRTTITGWPEAAEDLDLLGPGPAEANGIEVVRETPRYYDEDEQEHVAGYTELILAFEDADRLGWASNHLYDKATERFEWGTGDGDEVQDFAGAIPNPRAVEGDGE